MLYVHDNSNLQELFEEEVMANLTIGKGDMHFQYNSKLCYNKIVDFAKAVRYENRLDPEEVSEQTNGNSIACKYLLRIIRPVVFGGIEQSRSVKHLTRRQGRACISALILSPF